MVEMLALAISVISLVVSFWVARLVFSQISKVTTLNTRLTQVRESQEKLSMMSALPEPFTPSPLEGCRVALCIEQDHKLPILVDLIKERLQAEDSEVVVLLPDQADELSSTTKWEPGDSKPNVLIRGKVRCNEYKEVYYEADLTFVFAEGVVTSILENPPNGSRQANLAIAVVKMLKQTLEQSAKRLERRTALGELREG
jgi:hypothetical protein